MMKRRKLYWLTTLLATVSGASAIRTSTADEGMWLFNAVPKTQMKATYGFEPTQEWLDHVMLSSVRFNSGGSASFVSSNGLVLTNHHVASDTLYKLSTAENNYNENGFLAKSQSEEIKAPDLELNQLISIEDVTARVNAAVKADLAPQEAAKARQAVMATIEKESLDKTGLRSDVVTLFGGGRYHLYRYKNDLVFVSGNPGRTRRILTQDAIEYQRDVAMPRTMNTLRRKEILMQQYGLAGPEQKRRSKDDLFGIQNSRKAISGMLLGLQDPGFTASKKAEEDALRKKVAADPKLAPLAAAWDQIKQAQEKRKEWLKKPVSMRTKLYSIAETLVLMAKEDAKPSAERLREYRDSNRESLLQELLSEAPLYEDLERVQLADELARLIDDRGGNDPIVALALAGKNPKERANQLIDQTDLFSLETRKKLAAGGLAGIADSKDPMIQLARSLEAEYRKVHEAMDSIEEQERQAYSKITEAKFAVGGDSMYPDATFTLRLSYGAVRGYESNGSVPAWTTLGGAFEHEKQHMAEDPWVLPTSWKKSKDKLKSNTPFNFVCTADIIGGNSGSPVVSRDGAMVGIIFDGNIESLTADFYYTDKVSRAVAVHIAGVLESLRTIYDASHLADEMGK